MKVDGYYVYTLLDCGVVKLSLSASNPCQGWSLSPM